MARNEDAHAVARTEAPRRPRRAGSAGKSGELPVGHHLAARNRPKLGSAAREKVRAEVELDGHVVEGDGITGEVRTQALEQNCHEVVTDT